MRKVANRCLALVVIDNAPLQHAAWGLLQRARKRLERATRDLHRHEEVDEPGFRAWMAATFPTLLTTLRELVAKIAEKSALIQAVEEERRYTGRPASRIWREWKANGGRPPERTPEEEKARRDPYGEEEASADEEAMLDEAVRNMCGYEGFDQDGPEARACREYARKMMGLPPASEAAEESDSDAREIYRRLVLILHPDRGGEWTVTRARLWDQVQRAWKNRDIDWLSRLEAEWEASADLLGPTSPLGRLKLATREVEAARRDAERRLREYRNAPAWGFSRTPRTTSHRNEVFSQLRSEIASARWQLGVIQRRFASWERAQGVAKARES